MRSLVPIALVAAVLAVPTSASAQESCRGQEATIVGTPGGTATGTPGDDVIVTNGAATTDGGAGSDAICVTAGPYPADTLIWSVDAGDGGDVVDTTALRDLHARARVVLGLGADTFEGGAGRDMVNPGSVSTPVDDDVDTVATGRGRDGVETGQAGEVNDDDVDFGRGNDSLRLEAGHPDGVLDGGPGKNSIEIVLPSAGHWRVDDETDQLSVAGTPVSRWTAFNVTFVTGRGTDEGTFVRYIGSTGNDTVRLDQVVEDADLGTGDDELTAGNIVGTVSGGAGNDSLTVYGSSVELDLPEQRVSTSSDGTTRSVGVSTFERFVAQGVLVRITGSPGADVLGYNACKEAVVHGGGGDDLLSTYHYAWSTSCARHTSYRVLGGPGDDLLNGSRYQDHLDGGPGTDEVRGRRANDWCRGEIVRNCERP